MQSKPAERPGAPFPQHFRLKHVRSKSGCLPCRRRKKKCDETRPSCTACKRNGISCEWTDQVQTRSRNSTSTLTPSVVSINRVMSTVISSACDLTPESLRLLEHYTNVTAILLPAWAQNQAQNPFVGSVLRVAYDNDLLMHAVLAVSGAHLSHKLAGIASVEQATYKHYSYVLRRLRQDIGHGPPGDMQDTVRLLLVLAFLCQYEILAGSAQAILSLHLQAIQQTFSRLSTQGPLTAAQSNDTNDLLSLIYEGYSYMALCNLIVPTPQPRVSTDFLSVAAPNLGLKLSPCLSTIFGGSRLLFEMIPRANALFCRRLAEQSAGETEPTSAFLQDYAELSLGIETWKMPLPSLTNDINRSTENGNPELSEWAHSNMAAEFIRHALRIYILAAQLGSDPPTPEVDSAIQTNVEAMAKISRIIAATPYASTLMWAVIVGGSCVKDEIYRQELAFWLRTSHYQMRHLSLVLNALELLWADPSPNAFGPYGLRYISEKHDLNFCIM